MVSVNPMQAVAAYRSAAMSMVANRGITSTEQAQFRTEGMRDQLGGPSPAPYGINNSINVATPSNAYWESDKFGPKLSFPDLVKQGIDSTVNANRHAEYISMEGVAGRADISEVVTAIAHAQESLSTLVTIRDRMITAYQEVMRMPI